MRTPEWSGATVRYRFISPIAYVSGPIAFLTALRVSVVLAVVVLVVLTALIALLLRIGSDLSADGVRIRHVGSQTVVPWHDVDEVETAENWNVGRRMVLVRRDGQRLTLPAPTSKTGRFAEALSRARAEVARQR